MKLFLIDNEYYVLADDYGSAEIKYKAYFDYEFQEIKNIELISDFVIGEDK